MLFPKSVDDLLVRHESSFDPIKIKDEELIFSPSNNRFILEFVKPKEGDEKNEFCFARKIVVGNCRLMDPKNEKPTSFEITMPVKSDSI